MKTLINSILETSTLITNDRNEFTILAHVMEEVGELAQEITIACGSSYKDPGKDGVIGEAIDSILALVDLIYIHSLRTGVSVTEELLVDIAANKLEKWKSTTLNDGKLNNETSV